MGAAFPQDPFEQSVFRYVGDSIAAGSGISGAEITVDKLGENSLLDHATRNVSEVLTQQVPVIRSGEFVNERARPPCSAVSCCR